MSTLPSEPTSTASSRPSSPDSGTGSDAPAPALPKSFWQRRIRAPLLNLLTHGATPEKLASGIASAAVCSLFPFLGLTTALNAGVALWRKLNQPLMQAINYALSPLHLVMILVYVRLGELIWVADDEHFSIGDLVTSFKDLSLGDFFHKFGWAGVHAFTAWALTAPFLYFAVYALARPALRRLSHLLPTQAGSQTGNPS